MTIARPAHELGLFCDCADCRERKPPSSTPRRGASTYSRSRCSICNGDQYFGSRLCEDCRADPANSEWHTATDEVPVEDVGAAEALPANYVEAQQLTPIRCATALQAAVLELLLVGDREKVQRKRADTGGTFSTYYRSTRLTNRQIAKRVGCSEKLVRRIAARFLFSGQEDD